MSNLLETGQEHCHRLLVPHPILTNEELAAIAHMDYRGYRTWTIDITWPRSEGAEGLVKALDRICTEAEQAIDDGYSLIVLSDRRIAEDRIPVGALLATGAVHHHLVRQTKRTRIGMVEVKAAVTANRMARMDGGIRIPKVPPAATTFG